MEPLYSSIPGASTHTGYEPNVDPMSSYSAPSLEALGVKRIEVPEGSAPSEAKDVGKHVVFVDPARNWQKFVERLNQREAWEAAFVTVADQVVLAVIARREAKRNECINTLRHIRSEGFNLRELLRDGSI